MTAQIPDRIVIDGVESVLLATPLDGLLRRLGDRVPTFVAPHTGNWRGYTAGWRVTDGRLFLDSVDATIRNPDSTFVTVGAAVALDGAQLPMFAEWVSGQLRVGSGRVVRYVHADFGSRWEREVLLEVDAGRVIARHDIAEPGPLGSAGPYRLQEPLLGEMLSGGGFGQVLLAIDLDGRPLVAKMARPRGGGGGTEMWQETPDGRRPMHLPAQAFRQHPGGGLAMEVVAGETLQGVLRNEAELLERDAGQLLPRSYGMWPADPGGMPVLVMERLEGRRPSTADDVMAILRSLQQAVERGTFDAHGDVKPEHVFITDSGVRICDPAPRFDDPRRRGFTPLYNPRGLTGPAADVAACATMLRYLPDGRPDGWQWCAAVLGSTPVPDWAHHHGSALAVLAEEMHHPTPPPPDWVVPPLPDPPRSHDLRPDGPSTAGSAPRPSHPPIPITIELPAPITIEPPAPQRPVPSPWPPPAPPASSRPPLGPDEAHDQLDELRKQAPRTWSAPEPRWLSDHMAQLSDVLDVLHPQSAAARDTRAVLGDPNDPDRWYRAGWALIDAGLSALAVAPLALANALRPGHPPTVDGLALALEATGRPDEAARLYREAPGVLEVSEPSRALYSHYAAMDGDLDAVRAMVPQIDEAGPLGFFRARAADRLARHDALRRAPASVAPLDDRDLRVWEFVLHGMLLLSQADTATDEMRGRYAARWDSPEHIASVLDLLEVALGSLGRTVTHIAAAPDRNSQIVGRVIAGRLGLPPPVDLHAATPEDATTLVVLFDWSVDGDLHETFQRDAGTILFAYSINWTHGHSIAPDVVGMEAQALFPAWAARMRIDGDPTDLAHPDPARRPRILNVPADDRPIVEVAAELLTARPAADAGARTALRSLVDAARTTPHCVGALGGRRARFFPGGPVASARFDDR